jgi:hypothetical protein
VLALSSQQGCQGPCVEFSSSLLRSFAVLAQCFTVVGHGSAFDFIVERSSAFGTAVDLVNPVLDEAITAVATGGC